MPENLLFAESLVKAYKGRRVVDGVSPMYAQRFLAFILATMLYSVFAGTVVAADGDTNITKWKDDMTGVFLLMFDDGTPEHLSVVIPLLTKNGMKATFYLNPGQWNNQSTPWNTKQILNNDAVVFGNHSWDHKQLSAPTYAAAVKEQIKPTQDYFRKNLKGKWPRLVSFARPGSTPGPKNFWLTFVGGFTEDSPEFIRLMNDFDLVKRPAFASTKAAGSPPSAKHRYVVDSKGALSLADSAIKNQSMEYLIFHGIETPGVTKKPLSGFTFVHKEFIAFMDGLKLRMNDKKLWVTDHISYYKYDAQRSAAKVSSVVSPNEIIVSLTYDIDKELYDSPLTLRTKIPASWSGVKVIQNGVKLEAIVENGFVRYNANQGEIKLVK
jgi:peptidoglycan/xylan/chitin deacetylase (PgdA/CDA1 family)